MIIKKNLFLFKLLSINISFSTVEVLTEESFQNLINEKSSSIDSSILIIDNSLVFSENIHKKKFDLAFFQKIIKIFGINSIFLLYYDPFIKKNKKWKKNEEKKENSIEKKEKETDEKNKKNKKKFNKEGSLSFQKIREEEREKVYKNFLEKLGIKKPKEEKLILSVQRRGTKQPYIYNNVIFGNFIKEEVIIFLTYFSLIYSNKWKKIKQIFYLTSNPQNSKIMNFNKEVKLVIVNFPEN